nr:PREDICTED: AT-rich interactive domain-containing protein 5B-like isoform X2 [Lepisosteus oculatus]
MRECGGAMEHNTIQWLGAPCCLRGSYAFYKSFRCCGEAGRRPGVWRLGEFYFVRCGPLEPVCIAEVTLLWEDQSQRHLLASSRLYFLPEDTPKGRTGEHGEDEVLAVSRKIVIRVEDLVKWTCPEPVGWGRTGEKDREPSGVQTEGTPRLLGAGDSSEERSQGGGAEECLRVKVLSYPQYCRFRSLQKRMQDRARGPGLRDPHLLALGGVQVSSRNTRILYCRDTFNHPTLDSNASVWTEFGCNSLSLKGRTRKRKGRDGKGVESRHHSQSEAWIERMKENVMGSVEAQCESTWLPQAEEQHFLDQLYLFMESRGSPICKVPNLGFKKIDLFLLFTVVKKMGGYETVTAQRLWKQVYNELGGSPGSTSAATCTRRHYERLILPYARHLKGEDDESDPLPTPQTPSGSREAQTKRKAQEQIQKETKTCSVPSQESRVRLKGAEGPKQARARSRASPAGGASRPGGGGSRQHQIRTKDPGAVLPAQQVKPGSALGGLPVGPKDGAARPLSPLQELRLGRVSGAFPLTQGLSPLDILKSRLGYGASESLASSSQDPRRKQLSSTPLPLVLLQPGAEETGRRSGSKGDGDPLSPEKIDHTQPLSPSSLAGLQRLYAMGSISLPKDMSPLDYLKTRLGLGTPENPSMTSGDSGKNSAPHPSFLFLQHKAGSAENKTASGKEGRPQSLGSGAEGGIQKPSLSLSDAPVRDGRTRHPIPPLKIIPLDIDCSLQVRQLMRTPLGSSQFHCFTKKLSEVLAQDLSKTRQHGSPASGSPEQIVPLNLSKRCTIKRPADDLEAQGLPPCLSGSPSPQPAKRPRPEWEAENEPGRPLKQSSRFPVAPAAQEEPADLSSPERARAKLQEARAQQDGRSPQGVHCSGRPASFDLDCSARPAKPGAQASPCAGAQGGRGAPESPAGLCRLAAPVRAEASEVSPPGSTLAKARQERASRRARTAAGKEEPAAAEERRAGPAVCPLYRFRGRQGPLGETEASCAKQVEPECFPSEVASLLNAPQRALQSQSAWPVSPHGR